MPRGVKRAYDTSRRRAQAEATRRQVIDAALPLFVEQGYETTSMRRLADAGGVSLQTLYNAFGSKFGLFSALMDVVVAGDHEPVAVADRPEVTALTSMENPSTLLRAAVRAAIPILERLAVIYPALRAAAESDPDVAEAYQRFVVEARHDDHRITGRRLAELGALPAGMDADKATDVVWTVLSPDTFHLLVGHRGWTPLEFEAWASDTLVATFRRRRGGARPPGSPARRG